MNAIDGARQRNKDGARKLLTASVREVAASIRHSVMVKTSEYLEECIALRIWKAFADSISILRESIFVETEEAKETLEDPQGSGHVDGVCLVEIHFGKDPHDNKPEKDGRGFQDCQ